MKIKIVGYIMAPFLLCGLLLFPCFMQARRIGRRSASHSNMRQLAFGTFQYAQDHDGVLPPMDTPAQLLAALYPRYVKDADAFVSVYDGRFYQTVARFSRGKLERFDGAGPYVFLYDAPTTDEPGQRMCAFLDGTVRVFPDCKWDRRTGEAKAE